MAGNILVSSVQSLALKQLSAFEGDFAAPAGMNIIKLVSCGRANGDNVQ
jgi:hypothetical protein